MGERSRRGSLLSEEDPRFVILKNEETEEFSGAIRMDDNLRETKARSLEKMAQRMKKANENSVKPANKKVEPKSEVFDPTYDEVTWSVKREVIDEDENMNAAAAAPVADAARLYEERAEVAAPVAVAARMDEERAAVAAQVAGAARIDEERAAVAAEKGPTTAQTRKSAAKRVEHAGQERDAEVAARREAMEETRKTAAAAVAATSKSAAPKRARGRPRKTEVAVVARVASSQRGRTTRKEVSYAEQYSDGSREASVEPAAAAAAARVASAARKRSSTRSTRSTSAASTMTTRSRAAKPSKERKKVEKAGTSKSGKEKVEKKLTSAQKKAAAVAAEKQKREAAAAEKTRLAAAAAAKKKDEEAAAKKREEEAAAAAARQAELAAKKKEEAAAAARKEEEKRKVAAAATKISKKKKEEARKEEKRVKSAAAAAAEEDAAIRQKMAEIEREEERNGGKKRKVSERFREACKQLAEESARKSGAVSKRHREHKAAAPAVDDLFSVEEPAADWMPAADAANVAEPVLDNGKEVSWLIMERRCDGAAPAAPAAPAAKPAAPRISGKTATAASGAMMSSLRNGMKKRAAQNAPTLRAILDSDVHESEAAVRPAATVAAGASDALWLDDEDAAWMPAAGAADAAAQTKMDSHKKWSGEKRSGDATAAAPAARIADQAVAAASPAPIASRRNPVKKAQNLRSVLDAEISESRVALRPAATVAAVAPSHGFKALGMAAYLPQQQVAAAAASGPPAKKKQADSGMIAVRITDELVSVTLPAAAEKQPAVRLPPVPPRFIKEAEDPEHAITVYLSHLDKRKHDAATLEDFFNQFAGFDQLIIRSEKKCEYARATVRFETKAQKIKCVRKSEGLIVVNGSYLYLSGAADPNVSRHIQAKMIAHKRGEVREEEERKRRQKEEEENQRRRDREMREMRIALQNSEREKRHEERGRKRGGRERRESEMSIESAYSTGGGRGRSRSPIRAVVNPPPFEPLQQVQQVELQQRLHWQNGLQQPWLQHMQHQLPPQLHIPRPMQQPHWMMHHNFHFNAGNNGNVQQQQVGAAASESWRHGGVLQLQQPQPLQHRERLALLPPPPPPPSLAQPPLQNHRHQMYGGNMNMFGAPPPLAHLTPPQTPPEFILQQAPPRMM